MWTSHVQSRRSTRVERARLVPTRSGPHKIIGTRAYTQESHVEISCPTSTTQHAPRTPTNLFSNGPPQYNTCITSRDVTNTIRTQLHPSYPTLLPHLPRAIARVRQHPTPLPLLEIPDNVRSSR